MITHTHQKMYDIYHNLKLRSQSASSNFAILKLVVDDNELKGLYEFACTDYQNAAGKGYKVPSEKLSSLSSKSSNFFPPEEFLK